MGESLYLFNATTMKMVKIFLELLYVSITFRAQGKSWSPERRFEEHLEVILSHSS